MIFLQILPFFASHRKQNKLRQSGEQTFKSKRHTKTRRRETSLGLGGMAIINKSREEKLEEQEEFGEFADLLAKQIEEEKKRK